MHPGAKCLCALTARSQSNIPVLDRSLEKTTPFFKCCNLNRFLILYRPEKIVWFIWVSLIAKSQSVNPVTPQVRKNSVEILILLEFKFDWLTDFPISFSFFLIYFCFLISWPKNESVTVTSVTS